MMSFFGLVSLWWLSVVPALAWAGPWPPGPEAWRQAGRRGIRGVTIGPIESSQQPEHGYGTAASAATLDALQAMGVNWVSITPFGRLWNLRATSIHMDFEAPYAQNRVAVRRMIAQAKARGMQVMVIPALWIDQGGDRLDIDPGSASRWQALLASYRRFILAWARDAAQAGADALSIGLELRSFSSRYPAYWQGLIAELRHVFPGLLTYNANWWSEADSVLFWPDLDLIGIQAFYPLADKKGASYADYRAGALKAKSQVQSLVERLQMPVLFTELGYLARRDAAVEPWVWPERTKTQVIYDEAEQARAYAAIFEAFLPEPWFVGFFIWRYYANLDDVSQEPHWAYSPHGKLAEMLLAAACQARWGVDPAAWPGQVAGRVESPVQWAGACRPFGNLCRHP
ncbi:MAG: glycoside hydrolase family 113 [Polyangiales bacterium]